MSIELDREIKAELDVLVHRDRMEEARAIKDGIEETMLDPKPKRMEQ